VLREGGGEEPRWRQWRWRSGGGAEEPQPPHPCSRKEAEKKNKKKNKKKKKDKQPAAAEKADHGDGSDDEDPEIAEDRLGAQLVADIRALTGGTGTLYRVAQALDEAGQDRLDHMLSDIIRIIFANFEAEGPANWEEGEELDKYAFGPVTECFEKWGVYDPEAFFHLFNGTHERSCPEAFIHREEDFSKSDLFELCEDLSDAVGDREFPPGPNTLKNWGRYSR
jgi:hypothetical protein